MKFLGEQLTQHLNSIPMTKYRLAKLSGVSESLVISLANGKARLSPNVIRKFVAVEGMPPLIILINWYILDEFPELSGRSEMPFQKPEKERAKK